MAKRKHPGGRPSDYTPELLVKAQVYLDVRPQDEQVHSIEGLADFIGVTRTTIYDWEGQEGKEEFSYIVEQIRHKQAKELVNKGLSGDFNSAIAKVLLTKHGYNDKQEIDHTTKGDKIDSTSVVSKLAEQMNELYRKGNISSDGTKTSSVGTETSD